MNLLYLPCHEVLEYDELRLLSDIPGVNLMSPGAYWTPHKGSKLRPPIDFDVPSSWVKAWGTINVKKGQDHKHHITAEAVEPFDVIVAMHHWGFIFNNLESFKGKKVVWRDIGQTLPKDEIRHIQKARDAGVKIVRYWGGYRQRDNYQGHDAVIPFGKYESDFLPWEGSLPSIAGVCQYMKARAKACRRECWEGSTGRLSRRLYGKGNQGMDSNAGCPDYRDLLQLLSRHKAYWYGGTKPAPYTLGLMEAMFAGVPVYAVREPGWESALTELLGEQQLCETSDQLRSKLEQAISLPREELAHISRRQVLRSKSKFGATKVKELWRNFLFNL